MEARGKYDKYDRNSEDQFRNGSYWQDHKPVIAQDEAVGHAVRATYMYAAMTDIAALKNERHFENAVGKLWDNVVGKKMYITGAIGSTRHGEAFGKTMSCLIVQLIVKHVLLLPIACGIYVCSCCMVMPNTLMCWNVLCITGC